MPFTPLHLGPGAAFKGIGGDRFSFMVFGGSQVLMDIEPGARMILGTPILHGPSHTILGAFLIGAVATLIGKPISEFALRILSITSNSIAWSASAAGAFIGTFSHVFLDAIMHADMLPWAPFSESNQLLGLISLTAIHNLCFVLGILGGLIVILRSRASRDN